MTLDALVRSYESRVSLLEDDLNKLAKALDYARALAVVWRHLGEVQKRVLVPDIDEAKRLIHHGDYDTALDRLNNVCAQAVKEYIAGMLGIMVVNPVCPHIEDIESLDSLVVKYTGWQRGIIAALLSSNDLIEVLGKAKLLNQYRSRLDELLSIIDETAKILEEAGVADRSRFEQCIIERIAVAARDAGIEDTIEDMIVYMTRLRDAARLLERIRAEIENIMEASKACGGTVCGSVVDSFEEIASRVKTISEIIDNSASIANMVEEIASKIHEVYTSLSGMRRALEKLAIRLAMEQGVKPPQNLVQTMTFIRGQVDEGKLSQLEVEILLYTASRNRTGLAELLRDLAQYPEENVLRSLSSLCSREILECSISIT